MSFVYSTVVWSALWLPLSSIATIPSPMAVLSESRQGRAAFIPSAIRQGAMG